MTSPLFLVRLDLDGLRLFETYQRQGWRLDDVDEGYLLHAWIEAAFGPRGLRPFHVERNDGRTVRVLAYAERDAVALRDHADRFAEPHVHAIARWETLAVKAMPTSWPGGMRLGFQVRAAPIVRAHDPETRKVIELDAFWAAARRAPGVPLDREVVYAEWLAGHFTRSGVVRCVDARVSGFSDRRVYRRTQGADRRARGVAVPDVLFDGTLEVTGQGDFLAFLAHGLGRHRAFGFGMIKVRPER